MDLTGFFTDVKSASNSEYFRAYFRPLILLKLKGKRGLNEKELFAKLVSYMKNVYHIKRGLNKLSDGRVNPTYSTAQVVLPVLFGFLFRIESFNELNMMIPNHEFSKLFFRGKKLPKIDTIRDTLKVINLDGLKQVI